MKIHICRLSYAALSARNVKNFLLLRIENHKKLLNKISKIWKVITKLLLKLFLSLSIRLEVEIFTEKRVESSLDPHLDAGWILRWWSYPSFLSLYGLIIAWNLLQSLRSLQLPYSSVSMYALKIFNKILRICVVS